MPRNTCHMNNKNDLKESYKKKVLILGPSLKKPGGVSNFIKLIFSYFPREKYILKYFPIGQKCRRLYRQLIVFYTLNDIFKYLIRLICYKPDIVHINLSFWFRSFIRDGLYIVLSKLFGCKIMILIHGWNNSFYNKLIKKNILLNTYITFFFNSSDMIVVLGKIFKNKLVEFGIHREKIYLLSTMVEWDKYNFQILSPKENFTVLFMANFVKEKGAYELMKSIPIVIRKFPQNKINFIFAGDGPQKNFLHKMAKQLCIEDNIYFSGYITGNRKFQIYKKSNIFVYPSYYGEGLPTVIIEAMAGGLPVISTSVGAISEVIKDGENGIILRTINETEIAEKIGFFINNPSYIKRMGERNKEKAKNYDVYLVCRKLKKLYEQIYHYQK